MRHLFLTAFILFCLSFTVSAQRSELLLQHYRQAETLVSAQRLDEALREYQKVIELEPMLPQAYLGLGNIYLAQFKFDLALETYTQAIELKLQSLEIYCNRGIVYTKQGQYNRAIADFQQALTINTNYTPARFELGFVYQQIGEYEKAVKEYERVLPHLQGNLALHHNLARCYFRLGQVEAAAQQHEIAQQIRKFEDTFDAAQQKIREKPDDPNGHMALAKIYADHGKPQKAFEQYKTAILKDASLMEAYDKIAALYIQNQQGRKAITVYKTAIGVNSGYTKGHLMLGLLYQQSNQPKESAHHLEIAQQLAEKATEMTPNVQNLNMLGAIYLAMKDHHQAEAAFQKSLKLAPDNKQAQEYLHQVRQGKKSD
ncbi:MAG: tetratricopeptide repeat protein [Candidatus Poribacteria bacterium]|nr:tetratricopeptide repeat protein [Candidatus Poribacteria bacterium]